MKAKNPTAKITEITKIISEMWSTVDAATKSRLEDEYQKNKAKYDEDKAEYEEQHGKIERKKKKVQKKEWNDLNISRLSFDTQFKQRAVKIEE